MRSVFLFVSIVLHSIPKSISSDGSTPHLKDIVTGRCWEYEMRKQSKSRNCTAVWKAFYDSFAYKDPCTLTFADYEPFFDAVKGQHIVDKKLKLLNDLVKKAEGVYKALFWSGTYKAVHSYSDFDLRYTTLEDTFEGTMMNGLRWCGNPSLPRNTSDGIDYKSCPSCDIITAFWGQASQKFAERAQGVVRVMVNGTRVRPGGEPIPAYSNSSFFGKYELPSLDVSNITRLEVIVIHTINQKELEKCGSGTINLLQRDAESRGINVICKDDPDSVQHVLCTDYPQANECLFLARNKSRLTTNDPGYWKILSIVLGVASTLLLILTVSMTKVWCKNQCKKLEDDTVVLT